MSLVVAKCTQCGANIQVDNSKEAGICQFCGTAFITEKVISNYNIVNNTTIQNATINVTNAEKKEEFHTISIFRGSEGCGKIEILVDGISYAIIEKNKTIDILIDKNSTHRIQCVLGDEKSNVIFLEKGEKTNIKIVLTVSKTVKVPGAFTNTIYTFYSPNLEKTNIDCHEFKKQNEVEIQVKQEDERKKQRKKIITIISVIMAILLIIICPICVKRSDLKKYTSKYYDYSLFLDNTGVIVSYLITNNSSETRNYVIFVEITRKSDGLLVALGRSQAKNIINKGETKEIIAACYPTESGVLAGYAYIYPEDTSDLNVRIYKIVVDDTSFDL